MKLLIPTGIVLAAGLLVNGLKELHEAAVIERQLNDVENLPRPKEIEELDKYLPAVKYLLVVTTAVFSDRKANQDKPATERSLHLRDSLAHLFRGLRQLIKFLSDFSVVKNDLELLGLFADTYESGGYSEDGDAAGAVIAVHQTAATIHDKLREYRAAKLAEWEQQKDSERLRSLVPNSGSLTQIERYSRYIERGMASQLELLKTLRALNP